MTAATAALDPGPTPGPGSGADADDTVTVSWADFRAWERQLTTCTHPIRLRGRIDAIDLATGDVVWHTYEAQVPLLVVGDRLYAQAGVKLAA